MHFAHERIINFVSAKAEQFLRTESGTFTGDGGRNPGTVADGD